MVDLADRSLARAVVARYLKLALSSPHASSHRELNSARASAALQEAALVLSIESGGVTERKPPLSELVTGYVRLFGHSLRGRVCPYEIEYGKREPILQAQELSDVSGFYRAFGLEASSSIIERWDHIAVELEFVELLSTKEAYALETRQDEMFEVTRHALKRFVREHVGFFGIALGGTMEQEDPDGFYGRIGGLLVSFLSAISRELGVPTGPRTLPLSAFEDDGVPMACGGGVGSADGASFEV
jgi:TorA maturation chaperone TorD